jgi:hypothetical protein
VYEQTHHPEHFEELMSKWRKFYPEANISIGTLDGEEYMPPLLPSGGKGRGGGGGYFALPTAVADEEEEEEEVSLNGSGEGPSSLTLAAAAAYGQGHGAGRGAGILQQDQLTGSSGARHGEGKVDESSFIV